MQIVSSIYNEEWETRAPRLVLPDKNAPLGSIANPISKERALKELESLNLYKEYCDCDTDLLYQDRVVAFERLMLLVFTASKIDEERAVDIVDSVERDRHFNMPDLAPWVSPNFRLVSNPVDGISENCIPAFKDYGYFFYLYDIHGLAEEGRLEGLKVVILDNAYNQKYCEVIYLLMAFYQLPEWPYM
jgi:hypothetical protein